MSLDQQSTKDPGRLTTFIFRWGIPVVVILAGVVAAGVGGDLIALEGAAGLVGSGLAWILTGYLFREGVKGDDERHVEDAAREYLDDNGRWPTDQEYAEFNRSGRWTTVSVATPEHA